MGKLKVSTNCGNIENKFYSSPSLQPPSGLHEGRGRAAVEGLLLRHPDVPAVLSAVPLQPPVHVHMLHGGNEGEDCRHGPSLQEGG